MKKAIFIVAVLSLASIFESAALALDPKTLLDSGQCSPLNADQAPGQGNGCWYKVFPISTFNSVEPAKSSRPLEKGEIPVTFQEISSPTQLIYKQAENIDKTDSKFILINLNEGYRRKRVYWKEIFARKCGDQSLSGGGKLEIVNAENYKSAERDYLLCETARYGLYYVDEMRAKEAEFKIESITTITAEEEKWRLKK